jgi:hypothetical protein
MKKINTSASSERRTFLSLLTLPALAALISSNSVNAATAGSCSDIASSLDLNSQLDALKNQIGDISYSSSSNSSTWNFSGSGTTTLSADLFAGTSVKAKYADLAERYHADSDSYSEGDVLGIGGVNEVTLFQQGMHLAGVVSVKPAFRMNDSDKNQRLDMPFIALKGRVPVKVNCDVKKGDLIIASSNGKGIIGRKSDDSFIGVALSDSINGIVEVKI